MNIGIIGTSFILDTILEKMKAIKTMHCIALYSRKEETGKPLAKKFGINQIYTSLEAMCTSPQIDWIYVVSPNSLHYEQAKMALLAGKNVLCEKPFTTTAAQAKELARLAREKKLFLFEAILPLYHPHYSLIQEYLPKLGAIKLVLATFCQYSSRYDALLSGTIPNVFNPEFAGGALMDLNLYNIYFTIGLFGQPASLHYYPTLFANGIDTSGILIMEYPGFLAQCTAAKDSFCENGVQLLGEKGYIKVSPTASNCQQVQICLRGEDPLSFSANLDPWTYELQAIASLVDTLAYDECYQRLGLTITVTEVLESARKSGKLNF